MRRLNNDIDSMITKILSEEIEKKSQKMSHKVSGEWVEIDTKEALHGGQKKLDVAEPKGKLTPADFKKLRTKKRKVDVDEQETDEGNAFGKAVADAKKSNKNTFDFKGKNYDVKNESKNVKLTEDELISLIEEIVLEQNRADEKTNISVKEPEGYKKTKKALDASKKENDDYAKEVVQKFKDYLKTSTKASYDPNPSDFPRSNYQIDKEAKIMKYTPSEAVDEYIDAFAYPGQTNIVYDEIKPEDEKIDKYLKGHRTTGNAEMDEEGKALGNVVPSKVGEKFKKNYDENLYGIEQKDVSYKRYPQDTIEVAGNSTKQGKLQKKTQKIMNQLESVEDKKSKVMIDEIYKMKNLIGYNSKTQ